MARRLNGSPTKRRVVPTPEQLKASHDALPKSDQGPIDQPPRALMPPPTLTIRASSEREFKRLLARDGRTFNDTPMHRQAAATVAPRYRHDAPAEKLGREESSAEDEASSSHAGLNAGSDSNSDSIEVVRPPRRKSPPKRTQPQVPVPLLSLKHVRNSSQYVDQVPVPPRRLETQALEGIPQPGRLRKVVSWVLRSQQADQKGFHENLSRLLVNFSEDEREALARFERQAGNGSSDALKNWCAFVHALNQCIQIVATAALAKSDASEEERGSDDGTNPAIQALRRAPASSTLFDFMQANRDFYW